MRVGARRMPRMGKCLFLKLSVCLPDSDGARSTRAPRQRVFEVTKRGLMDRAESVVRPRRARRNRRRFVAPVTAKVASLESSEGEKPHGPVRESRSGRSVTGRGSIGALEPRVLGGFISRRRRARSTKFTTGLQTPVESVMVSQAGWITQEHASRDAMTRPDTREVRAVQMLAPLLARTSRVRAFPDAPRAFVFPGNDGLTRPRFGSFLTRAVPPSTTAPPLPTSQVAAALGVEYGTHRGTTFRVDRAEVYRPVSPAPRRIQRAPLPTRNARTHAATDG